MRSASGSFEDRTEGIGTTKAAMATGKCFVSAMLAGAFIAFGGMYFCVFLGDPTIPFAAQHMVGGICFCLGLVLVLCCGAELFTGNSHVLREGIGQNRLGRHAEELGHCVVRQSRWRARGRCADLLRSGLRHERWRRWPGDGQCCSRQGFAQIGSRCSRRALCATSSCAWRYGLALRDAR